MALHLMVSMVSGIKPWSAVGKANTLNGVLTLSILVPDLSSRLYMASRGNWAFYSEFFVSK